MIKRHLRDNLTYTDLAGRRHLRHYVLAALLLAILIALLSLWVSWQRIQATTARMATVLPLAEIQLTSTLKATLPTSIPGATLATCPVDAEGWRLLETVTDDNFERIEPGCVYDGLAQTVAWELLTQSMGYSGPEALRLLNLAEIPRRPQPEIVGMTNHQGPQPIPLLFSGEQGNSFPEDFHLWQVDQAGQPRVVYTLRGCFRTYTITGNRVDHWGGAYPVLCIFSVDQTDWVVMEFAGHQYANRITPRRTFQIYGYAGEGLWVEIGTQRKPVVQIGSGPVQVAGLVEEPEAIRKDQLDTAARSGLVPWDETWLEATFAIHAESLPEGWQTSTDPAQFQAIQAALRTDKEVLP